MTEPQKSETLPAYNAGNQIASVAPVTQQGYDLLSGDVRAHRQRQLIDKLNSLGIGDLVSIPKIAVVGSQSAGKSSILEALSGLTFPRSVGTCTRCPTEVRLFSGDQDWECNVSLRFEKDANGNRLDSIKNVPFGDPIHDPSEVHHRLKRAQHAILNPSKPPNAFLAMEIRDEKDDATKSAALREVHFSENVICVSVKGRNIRDLAVVDLPGLIANVGEKEDKRNIELIRDLAKREIAKPDCVILLCITMSEDFQNQPSVTLAREADPDGLRTIGVLTKPDRVEDGAFHIWKPVLEGKEQRLRHKYYVVKNLDSEQLETMNLSEARQAERASAEKAFFRQGKWASLNLTITSRLGSDRLAAKLSILLEEIIRDRLPELIKEVRTKHTKVKEGLNNMPAELDGGNALQALHAMVKEFGEDFQDAIYHNRDGESTAQKMYDETMGLWQFLLDSRPRFLLVTATEAEKLLENQTEVTGVSALNSQAEHISEIEALDLEAKSVPVNRTVKPDTDELKEVKKFVGLVQRHDNLKPLASPESGKRLYLTLSALKKIKSWAAQDMLPNNCPWSVKEELIEMCVKNWRLIAMNSLEDISKCLLLESDAIIKDHFERFRAGKLKANARRIMEKIISGRAKETKAFLDGLVTLESRYTTINSQAFLKEQKTILDNFTEARMACKLRRNGVNRNGNEVGISQALDENVTEELHLAAEILAYWQVAFRRFTDNVRAAMYTIFIRSVVKDCVETFPAELGLFEDGAASKAKQYLQEDPNIVQIRADLVAQELTLASGLDVINAFSTGAL